MQCTCGSDISERNHEVKTLSKAKEWLAKSNLTDNEIEQYLPILIEQHECPSCKRFGYQVLAKNNNSKVYNLKLHVRI